MLVKNESEWCWCIGGNVGYPEKSIHAALEAFVETNPAEKLPMVRVGNPYYYIPTIDADRVIEDVVDYDLDDEIVEFSEDYLYEVEREHIDELQNELTDVFRKWEKRHGYNNTSFVVLETINPFEDKD